MPFKSVLFLEIQKILHIRLKANKNRLEELKMNKILKFVKIPLRNILLMTQRNEIR